MEITGRKTYCENVASQLEKNGIKKEEVGIRHINRGGMFKWVVQILVKGERRKAIKRILKKSQIFFI